MTSTLSQDRAAEGEAPRPQGALLPEALPSVVTVSAIHELREALRERDARIRFLEKELVERNLQLAQYKTREGTLLLELHRTGLAAAPAKAAERSSEAASRAKAHGREVSDDSGGDDVDGSGRGDPRPHLSRSLPRAAGNVVHHGDAFLAPLGQPVNFGVRTANFGAPTRPDGLRPRANLNPGSCASGLGLLAGDDLLPPSTSSSRGSIDRLLGDIGLASSNALLRKRRGDDAAAAAGRRRVRTAPFPRRNEGWGEGGEGGTMVAARPPRGNLFANCLLSSHSAGLVSSFTSQATARTGNVAPRNPTTEEAW